MANSDGKSDETRIQPHDDEARAENSAAPEQPDQAPIPPDTGVVPEAEPRPNRLAQLARQFSRPSEASREAKSGERTRGLVILAGTTIACLFLFFGLFTTDSESTRKERRTAPNLGRPEAPGQAEGPNRSPVPQLSVNQQGNEEPGELSERDVLGTMRNRGTTPPPQNTPPPAPPKRTPHPNYALNTVNFDDPALAEAYRRRGILPPGGTVEVGGGSSAALPPVPVANVSDSLRKSSIVFVRSGGTTGTQIGAAPVLERKTSGLLPQGTALVARLQHSVSSAAKVPVTAVIEYNYEDGGRLIVPAGTKAYGDLAQATPQGWVSLKFHTLEFPNGDQETINGSAISMERTALRGDVNGKNGAKKFLTRTLTGVGTIAAFAVGGRGLTGGIDNSVLLRERLASNIALAGEQELAMLAYQQNIVVTVPANTRFYLVLHEAGMTRPSDSALQRIGQQPLPVPLQQTSSGNPVSEQELREMMQLRNELREMNRLMQSNSQRPDTEISENR
jgi:hypothetical protein